MVCSFCIASDNKLSTLELNKIRYFEITSKFYTLYFPLHQSFWRSGGQGKFLGGYGVPKLS